jgi:hypothetical protein
LRPRSERKPDIALEDSREKTWVWCGGLTILAVLVRCADGDWGTRLLLNATIDKAGMEIRRARFGRI